MSEPITIPYAPGVNPLTFDIPAFTNADPRLRPQWTVPVIKGPNGGYVITPQAFPALYQEFHAMLIKAGAPNYELVVSNQIAPLAGRNLTDRNVHRILINQHLFNTWKFDELTEMIVGHEVGHAWRFAHPHAKQLPAPAPFTPTKTAEYEADMLGLCLHGNLTGFNQWMADKQEHGNPADYPTNPELMAAVRSMHWSDCPVPAPMPIAPPLLRARNLITRRD